MIEDCPRCAGRGWIYDRREEYPRECEACDGCGIVDTAPDDPRAIREPDSLGGSPSADTGAPNSILRISCGE